MLFGCFYTFLYTLTILVARYKMDTETYDVYNFQDSATPIAEAIIDLHNYIFFYLIIVLVFVMFIMFDIFRQSFEMYKFFNFKKQSVSINKAIYGGRPKNFLDWRKSMLRLNKINHATNLEIVWTVFPSFILILIAIPSLSLLYSMDEMLYPEMTFKAIGYQWYWSYELTGCALEDNYLEENFKDVEPMPLNFDSYMQSIDWNSFGHRLLAVDVMLALPVRSHLRILVTGADVLHSWAVPAFGVKIDAVPGRINQGAIFVKRLGVFYGQCSELCGVNHGFMPIVVHIMEFKGLHAWASGFLYFNFKKVK